jgi:hypothetical protein
VTKEGEQADGEIPLCRQRQKTLMHQRRLTIAQQGQGAVHARFHEKTCEIQPRWKIGSWWSVHEACVHERRSAGEIEDRWSSSIFDERHKQ